MKSKTHFSSLIQENTGLDGRTMMVEVVHASRPSISRSCFERQRASDLESFGSPSPNPEPRGLATRAKVILLSADHPEWTLAEIGAHVGLCDDTVGTWRKRFATQRLEWLSDAPKSGAPRTIQDEAIKRVVRWTLDTMPEGETHWSKRNMAQTSGLTQSARRSPITGPTRPARRVGDPGRGVDLSPT